MLHVPSGCSLDGAGRQEEWSAVEEASAVSQERGQLGGTWLLFSDNSGLAESVQRKGNLEKGCFLLCASRGGKGKGQIEVDL